MRPKLARRIEPQYFIRLSAEASEEGPLSLEVLRERAEAGEISRETWFRLETETEYHQFQDDLPLAADLWPEDEPFDPEATSETAFPAEDSGDEEDFGEADTRDLLKQNLERDRETRLDEGEAKSGLDWQSLSSQKGVIFRWIAALILLAAGIGFWATGDDTSTGFAVTFVIGISLIVFAIVLTIPETVRIIMTPLSGLIDTLFQGSGGGGGADYWTADALLAQGDYRLAAAEYRRIVLEHPREVEAYLKGIRASRELNNEKEESRFRELAMKNLKSEQDRNLFLSSLERMK